jgi:hypothetical protein
LVEETEVLKGSPQRYTAPFGIESATTIVR